MQWSGCFGSPAFSGFLRAILAEARRAMGSFTRLVHRDNSAREEKTEVSSGIQAKQPLAEVAPSPTEDEIRRRAYEIYCARNGDPGDDLGDWLRAECELKEKYRRIKEYSAETINVFA